MEDATASTFFDTRPSDFIFHSFFYLFSGTTPLKFSVNEFKKSQTVTSSLGGHLVVFYWGIQLLAFMFKTLLQMSVAYILCEQILLQCRSLVKIVCEYWILILAINFNSLNVWISLPDLCMTSFHLQ